MSIPAGMLLERFREKPMMIARVFALRLSPGRCCLQRPPAYEIALLSLFLIGIGMTNASGGDQSPCLRAAGGEEHFAALISVAAQLVFERPGRSSRPSSTRTS